MEIKPLKILFISMVMCVATGFIVYAIVARQQRKIAVVDAVRLFGAFNMKNELEAEAKAKLQAGGRELDSVGNALQMAQSLKNGEEIKKLEYSYNYLKAKLDNNYTQSNRDINGQAWKRLNPLLDEYGKSERLHVIIGANGMGSVLYNDEYYDRTNDVIKYVNKRYAGGN